MTSERNTPHDSGRSALTRLADAAATAQKAIPWRSGSPPAIGVVRGSDRPSRTRGELLRRKLRARGLTAVDILAVASTRAREQARLSPNVTVDDSYAALVDVTGPGHHEADRLAARTGVVLVALPEHGVASGQPRFETIPVITIVMTGTTSTEARRATRRQPRRPEANPSDVALRELVIRPTQPDTCRLRLTMPGAQRPGSPHAHSSLELPVGSAVTITLLATGLQIVAATGGTPDGEWFANTVTVEPMWGSHALTRDGLPVADLRGSLLACHERSGLRRRLV